MTKKVILPTCSRFFAHFNGDIIFPCGDCRDKFTCTIRKQYDTQEDESMLKRIDTLTEKPVNEDLEEVADAYNEEYSKYLYGLNTAFKAGAQWQKEQTINKACEWLKENIYKRVYKCGDELGFPTSEFLKKFKQAMED